jgi:hypothetical protein
LVNLNTQYYRLAIEKIYQTIEEPTFLVISDDLNYARKILPEIQYAEFKGETAIQDFIAFKNCSHQIIANSTFSWWAAWLNDRKDKKVIVPNYFLGFKVKKEFPLNIIPEAWSKQDVY